MTTTLIQDNTPKTSPSEKGEKKGKEKAEVSLQDAIARIEKETSLFLMEVDKGSNTLILPEKYMIFLESLVDIATAKEENEDGINEFAINKAQRKRIDNLLNVLLGRSTYQKDGSYKYTGLLDVTPEQNKSIFERMGWDELKGSGKTSRSFTNSLGL